MRTAKLVMFWAGVLIIIASTVYLTGYRFANAELTETQLFTTNLWAIPVSAFALFLMWLGGKE